jgi:hypothetical protein
VMSDNVFSFPRPGSKPKTIVAVTPAASRN